MRTNFLYFASGASSLQELLAAGRSQHQRYIQQRRQQPPVCPETAFVQPGARGRALATSGVSVAY